MDMLEAAVMKKSEDVGIKLAFLKTGESEEEAIIRSGFSDWPRERIICVRFVKPNHTSAS
jgi:hypothetical protein